MTSDEPIEDPRRIEIEGLAEAVSAAVVRSTAGVAAKYLEQGYRVSLNPLVTAGGWIVIERALGEGQRGASPVLGGVGSQER